MSDQRAAMHDVMVATLADERTHHDWYYRAVRPMPVPATWKPGQTVRGDCSKGCQYVAHWGHAPDPMGNGNGPYGNSQTIWLKLQHLAHPSELEVGDMTTMGAWGSEHAVTIIEVKPRIMAWSFGHQGAPNRYELSSDRRPQQWLRMPIVYVPTPADRLRARTGWFAWVAWRLGEGDFRHYGPTNGLVRPNVPRVIPATWWVRYGQFVAARKTGDKATTS